VRCQTFQVVGYLNGQRVRKKFKSRENRPAVRDGELRKIHKLPPIG